MKPYAPMSMVIGAQILPAEAIALNAKFGTVTMRLSIQTSGEASPTNTILYFPAGLNSKTPGGGTGAGG